MLRVNFFLNRWVFGSACRLTAGAGLQEDDAAPVLGKSFFCPVRKLRKRDALRPLERPQAAHVRGAQSTLALAAMVEDGGTRGQAGLALSPAPLSWDSEQVSYPP